MRKYARLFMNYRAVNSWSPPELLAFDKPISEIGVGVNTSQ